MKQLAHMAGMILNAKLFLDHPGDHGRGPDAAVEPVGDRAAVQDVSQFLSLLFAQLRRPTRPIPFQQTVHSLALVALEPLRDLRSRRLQDSRQFAAGVPFRIQHHRAQSLGYAVGAIPLCFLA